MIEITKQFRFEAAHFIPNHPGLCKNLHGHQYLLEVTISGELNEKTKMVMDFGDLKKIVKENIVDKYDHSYLNDYFEYPTAENMVQFFAKVLTAKLPWGINLRKIKLWETHNSYATWRTY